MKIFDINFAQIVLSVLKKRISINLKKLLKAYIPKKGD
jgi:hypothetical protein